MSNSVVHGLLRPAVLEHKVKSSCKGNGGKNLLQGQASSQIRKLTSDFRGQRLTMRELALPRRCITSGFPQAVLATDAPSEYFTRRAPGRVDELVDGAAPMWDHLIKYKGVVFDPCGQHPYMALTAHLASFASHTLGLGQSGVGGPNW